VIVYRKTLILLAATVAVVAGLSTGLTYVNFKPPLYPRERELTQFQYTPIKPVLRQPAHASNVRSPIDITLASKKDFPSTPLKEMAPAAVAPVEPKVSFVLIKDRVKMAIVGGKVVREGDTIEIGRVIRIGQKGVLIKEREGEKWLKME
jgi:hypothetical protein